MIPIESVRGTVRSVPTPGAEADGTLSWDETTAIVAEVRAGGEHGIGWSYGNAAAAAVIETLLAPTIVGEDAFGIPRCHTRMRTAARNALVPGQVGMAISAVDVALWHLKARLLNVAVVDLLGRARDTVPIYGSGGFTSMDDDQLREQLAGWVRDDGASSVKIKIGEDFGRDEKRDLHRVRLARETVGASVQLMVDANGAYQAKQAMRLAERFAEFGVVWFEEPVSSDHLDQLALIRGRIQPEVAAGEYGTSTRYFQRLCTAGAVDCLQVDATRCGGYTGFLAAASVAEVYGLQVSAHCAPYLHAPVCAAIPNLRHLEFFADHVRVEQSLFDAGPPPRHGQLDPANLSLVA